MQARECMHRPKHSRAEHRCPLRERRAAHSSAPRGRLRWGARHADSAARASQAHAISGNQTQSVAISGNQWQSVAIRGNPWHGNHWQSVAWQSVAISGNQWQSVAIGGNQWQSVAWQSVLICVGSPARASQAHAIRVGSPTAVARAARRAAGRGRSLVWRGWRRRRRCSERGYARVSGGREAPEAPRALLAALLAAAASLGGHASLWAPRP